MNTIRTKKLLLDECLNWRLLYELPEYPIKTVRQMGWSGLKNGELLNKAQHEFDVLITTDKNIKYQQNLLKYEISIVVLDVRINDLEHIQAVIPFLKENLLMIDVWTLDKLVQTNGNIQTALSCSCSCSCS